jgi:hypothetical protein
MVISTPEFFTAMSFRILGHKIVRMTVHIEGLFVCMFVYSVSLIFPPS